LRKPQGPFPLRRPVHPKDDVDADTTICGCVRQSLANRCC